MILNLVHTVGDIVLSINGPRQPNESQVDEANRISGPGTDCVHSRSLQGPSEFGDFMSQLGEPPRPHLCPAWEGVYAVGVPVLNGRGRPAASLGVATLAFQNPLKDLENFVPLLQGSAGKIAVQLP
jgi:hypothetical protein